MLCAATALGPNPTPVLRNKLSEGENTITKNFLAQESVPIFRSGLLLRCLAERPFENAGRIPLIRSPQALLTPLLFRPTLLVDFLYRLCWAVD